MANPEHVKIVKAGKTALDEWWRANPDPVSTREITLDLRGADFSGMDLRGAKLRQADLTDAKLEKTNLLEARVEYAVLEGANLKGANLDHTYFLSAKMDNAILENAVFHDTDFYGARLRNAIFKNTRLERVRFDFADLSGADLTNAFLTHTVFLLTKLHGASLDGITFNHTLTEHWELTDVKCTHFWLYDHDAVREYMNQLDRKRQQKRQPKKKSQKPVLRVYSIPDDIAHKRIPKQGFLAAGEFEDRLKWGLTGLTVDTKDKWLKVTEAAELLCVHRGVISRWVDKDKIKNNRKTGKARRVLKSSVLLMKHKREHEDLLKDAAEELQDRTSKILDRH